MHKIASFECTCTKRTVRNFRTVSFDAAEADKIVGDIGKYSWGSAVRRIGQLASEMGRSMGCLSIGGSNGNADELTNWDGTKKKRLGY